MLVKDAPQRKVELTLQINDLPRLARCVWLVWELHLQYHIDSGLGGRPGEIDSLADAVLRIVAPEVVYADIGWNEKVAVHDFSQAEEQACTL